MKNTLNGIVKGQEAICPDGLGRVIDFSDRFPHTFIQVSTYVDDRGCKWSPDNVTLVPLPLDRWVTTRKMTVDEAIKYAARHLPSGYRVRVSIEHEGYSVVLECKGRDGEIGVFMEEETLSSDIEEAVRYAQDIETRCND